MPLPLFRGTRVLMVIMCRRKVVSISIIFVQMVAMSRSVDSTGTSSSTGTESLNARSRYIYFFGASVTLFVSLQYFL